MSEDLLNRISTIKDELDKDIFDQIKVFKEIKTMIRNENQISENELRKVLKEFYKKNPNDIVNDDVINNIFDLDSHRYSRRGIWNSKNCRWRYNSYK